MKAIGTACVLILSAFIGLGQGFVEIGESLGINYDFNTDEYGGGVSFADFDQDGLDDLTFASGPGDPIRFHKNNGNGFTELEPLVDNTTETKQIFWIDYNNDKQLDLYVTSSNQNRLYKNLGNLSFQDVTSEVGLPDTDQLTFTALWMDYNNDGWLDLIVTYRTPEEEGWVELYRNIDGNSFIDHTSKAGLLGKGNSVLTMTSFDYNNDGLSDLFLAQDWEQGNQLFRNNGNGTFTDVSLISNANQRMNSMTASVADYNEDGWFDIYVSNTREGTILLRNNQDGTFTDVAEEKGIKIRSLTFGAIFFDADNDSDLDLHIVGGQVNYMFENMGNDVPYRRVNDEWGFSRDRFFNNGFSIGDYNNDGYADLVKNSMTLTGTVKGVNTFWKNNFSENNYLSVDLEGTVSNSFGIGAVISLHLGDRVLKRRVASGESFCSQLSYTQMFGVGTRDVIDKIVVEWPSGNISEVLEVSSNQKLLITEPNFGCNLQDACNYRPDVVPKNELCRFNETYYDCAGCINDADQDGVCDELEIPGCKDINSCSFNPYATEEDGSCTYLSTYTINGPQEVKAMVPLIYSYTENSESTYAWEANNGSVILGQGLHEVQVIWHNAEDRWLTVTETSVTNCVSETVKMEIAEILAPLGNLTETNIKAYPNPANDFVRLQGPTQNQVKILIYDIYGKLWLKDYFETYKGEAIDISKLKSGIYLIQVEEGDDTQSLKLSIQR